MSDLHPPFTPTPGGPIIAARIGNGYRWVYLKNSSNFDCLYSLAGEQPASTTSLYSQWDGRLEPGHGVLITLPSIAQLRNQSWQAQYARFEGVIWLALLNYSSSIAITGTPSGVTNVWVTGYYEWEGYPVIDASNANGSQYQQQRVISLNPGSTPFIGTFNATNGGSATLVIPPAATASSYNLSATNIANGQINVYLYGGFLYAGNTATNAQIQLLAFVCDVTLSPLGTGSILWQGQVWSGGITPRTHDIVPLVNGPVIPVSSVTLSGHPTATGVIMQIKCTGIQGTSPYPIDYNVIWAIDTDNIGAPTPNGFLLSLIAAGGGEGPY